MKEIQLKHGKVALVDDEDFDKVNQHHWWPIFRLNTCYAETGNSRDGTHMLMHELILPLQFAGQIRDHKDGNGLNNQKINLRLCNYTQNFANRDKYSNNTSGRKGVFWIAATGKWRAKIQVNGKSLYLGEYTEKDLATYYYNKAAREHFGEFAKLNLL